ncbi:MAG: hypothetical protein Q8P63_01795 [Candidatus Nealsonbacteria bacterium]|nr:hypothetical protein [Candidatus Nealsonbacteria bacterium]
MQNKSILIVIGIAVFVGAIGFWYYQKNVYSKDALKLEILAPQEAELAQEIEYTVRYKNNGDIKLEEPRLVFEFPKSSLITEGEALKKELILEDIYPGQEQTFTFKTRLLGKEGDIKTAKVWLNANPKNLKAIYGWETSHSTQIKSVPLTLEFDLPSKIDSGKEVSFKLNYFSNADYPLSNLGIKVEYPSDFEFQTSKPTALEKTEWEIGLLNKADGGRISIDGILRGAIGEQKQFKAQLGAWQDDEFVVLKETIRGIQIVTPSLYISQQINNSPQYVASAGDTLHYEIFFKNIGEDAFSSLFLVVNLEGNLFDFGTLKAPQGDFELGDNSIIFDWRRVSKLQFLNAQEEGKVEFWIDLKDDWQTMNDSDKNPILKNKIILSQAQEEFVTKVNSKLDIIQRGYYGDEVFGNTGPIPPEVGKQTTYTIIWQAKNYYNDIKSAQVRAVLGDGVKLTGNIFPENSVLTFDSGSREVIWKIGDLTAGKGVLDQAPSVAFQVSFTPLVFQAGATPILIGEAELSGEDQYTGLMVKGHSSSINTTLPDDTAVSFQQGIVR